MASNADRESVTRRRGYPLPWLWALLAALVLAGCGAGGPPSPSVTASETAGAEPAASALPTMTALPATATAAASAPPSPGLTPGPTEQPGGPPAATLVVGGGVSAPGMLGSYVWDGAGSDAPWIVPPPDRGVRARAPFAVTVVPPLEVGRWEAAWAPVDGDAAGDPGGYAEGLGDAIAVPGPGSVGTWSLRVSIRFAGGNHAAWYWRLEILP